jgi:protein TonB
MPSSASGSAADPVRPSATEDRQPTVDASFRGNRVPDYPPISRRLGEQGAVVLRVMISPDGRAGEIQLVKGSGYARLDRAAIEAVRDWRFVPASKGGRPVAAWYEWRWEFRLEN